MTTINSDYELNNKIFNYETLQEEDFKFNYYELELEDEHFYNLLNYEEQENFSYNNINHKENKKNSEITKNEKTVHNNKFKKKKVIFRFKKVKKLLGRKSKNYIYNKGIIHTKYNRDNIITKIKRNLYNNFLEFINEKIKLSDNKEIKKIKLKKINGEVIKISSREGNLNLLKKTLKEILSERLSSKYKKYISINCNYNKEKINYIFNSNEEELKNILNKNLREILFIYCNNNVENEDFEDFEKFKRLKDDIEKFKNKNEKEEYINLYENAAYNFEKIIKGIHPRKSRKRN